MAGTNAIKDINLEKVRTYMRQHRTASKSQIAQATDLSFPTVTRLMDTLCTRGEVREIGQDNATGGRSALLYALNPGHALCLLIRLESRVQWCIKDLDQTVVDAGASPCENGGVLEALDNLVTLLQNRYTQLRVILIGISALVADGAVADSHLFAELRGVNLALHFQNFTDLPVLIENDMKVVALGQWYRSRTRAQASVCIYLSQDGAGGPGAGIQINGEVWRGCSNYAGEISYLTELPYTMNKHPEREEVLEYYARLVQIFAVVFNPSQIILYDNPHINGLIEEIRSRCRRYLPSGALPNIERSGDFELDYDCGLYAIAQPHML